MSNFQDNIDFIIEYFDLEKPSPKEKQEFLNRCKNDSFKKDVKVVLAARETMGKEYRRDLRERNKVYKRKRLFKKAGIALAILTIGIISFLAWKYINTPTAPPNYIAKIEKPAKDVLNNENELIAQVSSDLKQDQQLLLKSALTAYQREDYSAALPLFSRLLDENNTQLEARLYRAICYNRLKQNDKAIIDLKRVQEFASNPQFNQKAEATWLLANIHIQENDLPNAQTELTKIKDVTNYKNKVTDLLKLLK